MTVVLRLSDGAPGEHLAMTGDSFVANRGGGVLLAPGVGKGCWQTSHSAQGCPTSEMIWPQMPAVVRLRNWCGLSGVLMSETPSPPIFVSF